MKSRNSEIRLKTCLRANLYIKTLFVTDSVTPLDTIGLFLSKELIGNDHRKQVKIIDFKETRYESGLLVKSGKVENFYISASDNGITIRDGSLSKFYLGNNIQQMTRKDTKLAFEKLSDTLHLPTEKAKVLKYHFARNLITDHPAKLYLEYFGPCPDYLRLPMISGIYYKQKSSKNELCAYDKIVEMKAKREFIPEFYLGKNVLRLEDRNNTNPSKYLNCSCLIGADLFDEIIYTKIFKNWCQKFSNIKILSQMPLDISELITLKELETAALIRFLKELGGPDLVLKKYDELSMLGKITRKQKSDIKKKIFSTMTDKTKFGPPELMIELQEKMKLSARYYR